MTIDHETTLKLRQYLNSLVITSHNIGDIRRQLMFPWDSPWNGLVRDETAKREVADAPVTKRPEAIEAMRAALLPFARLADAVDRQPLRGVADSFYGVHTGTEWEASISFSDCRAAKTALAELDALRQQLAEATRMHEQAEAEVLRHHEREDKLRAKLAEAEAERERLKMRVDYLNDLPLCRLQLSDGTVPGNTEEALQAWYDEARDAQQQVRVLSPGGTFAWKSKYEDLTTALSALVEKWNSEYQSALEHDRKHGLRESTVELGGKAIAADELVVLLAAHPEV